MTVMANLAYCLLTIVLLVCAVTLHIAKVARCFDEGAGRGPVASRIATIARWNPADREHRSKHEQCLARISRLELELELREPTESERSLQEIVESFQAMARAARIAGRTLTRD